MGARKNFVCRSSHLAAYGGCELAPPADGVVRVGSLVEVWNTDSLCWVKSQVIGFFSGMRSMDGAIVVAVSARTYPAFIPWTLIR